MNASLELTLDELEALEAPLTDMEWGIIAGAALGVGILIGLT